MKYEDPILTELRKFREEYAAQFNYDVAAMCNDLRADERRYGHQTVCRTPKPYLPPSQFLQQVEKRLVGG
jgi:hypothetical protein